MATNLKIDPKLLDKAKRLGKKKTKRETVNEALLEYVRKRELEGLVQLFGTVEFDPSYDYKSERHRATEKPLRRQRKSA